MRKDRFQEAESIFQAAVELPAADRDALVAAACGDDAELRTLVERLLRHHAAGMGGFLEPAATRELPPDEGATSQPSRIGPYRILESLGEGGMGAVYLAEQTTPIRRRVALKVIKPGMDTRQVVARFEAERQALAMMDHPGIARVFDVGATPEGRPYFVMEHVGGIPIDRYCDGHELKMSARLELFTQVCEAVQHAHQKGIIHRDLKPSNILVVEVDGRPVAKVIDFGVAKATAQRFGEEEGFTLAGQLIGTPDYMSPEQADTAGADVDTRTDVYALGVILYELLAGALPFDSARLREAGFEGVLKILREVDPPRPSTRVSSLGGPATEIAGKRRTDPRRLVGQLKGDLDWIVMRALEKDRERRYASSRELAEDIARHLRHEPVLAGPPSAVYRSRKFVRRHRVALGFVALAFLGVSAALIESNRQQRKVEAALEVAREERAHAVLEAEKATQVSRFLRGVLGANDPYDERYDLRDPSEKEFARRLLDQAATGVEEELADQPDVLAEVQNVIGVTYLGLSLYEEARPHLEAALAMRRELHGNMHPDVAASLESMGVLEAYTGNYQQAKSYATEALAIRRAVLGERHSDTARSLALLGALEWRYSPEANWHPEPHDGSLDRAEEYTWESLEIRKEVADELMFGISSCNRILMLIYKAREEYAAALTCAQAALEARLALVGPDHYLVSWDLQSLAAVHLAAGDPASAEPLLRQCRAIRTRLLGADHSARRLSSKLLGDCLADQGKYASADSFYVEALTLYREYSPESGTGIRSLPVALANVRRARGDTTGAEILVREALAWTRDQHGEQSLEYASVLRRLAEGYYPRGSEAAYLAYREEFSINQGLLGDDRFTLFSLVHAAEALSRIESRGPARFAVVDSLFGEARQMQLRINQGEAPWQGQDWLNRSRGTALLAQDRVDEAEPFLRTALEIVSEHAEEGLWQARAERNYGICLFRLGRIEEAESLLLRSYEDLRVKSPTGYEMRSTLRGLIDLYERRGDEERAREFETRLTNLE